jgi:hypothetical protein
VRVRDGARTQILGRQLVAEFGGCFKELWEPQTEANKPQLSRENRHATCPRNGRGDYQPGDGGAVDLLWPWLGCDLWQIGECCDHTSVAKQSVQKLCTGHANSDPIAVRLRLGAACFRLRL